MQFLEFVQSQYSLEVFIIKNIFLFTTVWVQFSNPQNNFQLTLKTYGFLNRGRGLQRIEFFLTVARMGLACLTQKNFSLVFITFSIFLKGLKANDSWGKELRLFFADHETHYHYFCLYFKAQYESKRV